METVHLLSKSEKLDEDDEAAILTILQSSDAESSSDDGDEDETDNTSSEPLPGDATVWKAAANIVNVIEGLGFPALPYALKEGGLAAIVAFIVVPVTLWYNGKILIECLYDGDAQGRKTRVRSTFKDLGDVLLPKYGGYIVSGTVYLELFLVSASYLILCGSIMNHALPSVPLTELEWTCIAGAIVLPTTFLKSLSQIAWLSTISLFALITAAVTVVWYGAGHAHEWHLDTILFWDTEGVIRSLLVIVYSYVGYLILPSVEASMSSKAKFSKALGWAYVISMFIKLFFSLFGFLSFGANTDEIILNNLPPGPVHITVSSIFVLSCILSYVLALYPLIETADSLSAGIQSGKIPNFLSFAVVRVTLVALTATVAILVPHFVVIISILASSSAVFICYIFPSVLHLKLKYNQLKISQVCADLFLVFFGVVTMIVGMTFSVKTLTEVP